MVNALHLKAERGGEVLLVTDHHVDVRSNRLVDLLRPRLAADGLPERGAVVQVIGDYGAVTVCRRDGLDHGGGRVIRERRIDATRVEPAHAELTE